MKSEEPRVRIIVRKGHGSKHHGGAWKVAYADFVTTLMALFIVLWIVGQNPSIKAAVAAYFKDPGAFREAAGKSPVAGGEGILPDRAPPRGRDETETPQAREEAALQATAREVKQRLKQERLLDSLRDQVSIQVSSEGLRIELMERDDSEFFKVGSAVVVHRMRALLEVLAPALTTLPNPIAIEGHTDSRPYVVRHDYSNWDLSSDRANSARRTLEAVGLPAGRVDRVVGHADRLLLLPKDPMNAANRRITILVRRQDVATAAESGTPLADMVRHANEAGIAHAEDDHRSRGVAAPPAQHAGPAEPAGGNAAR